MLRKAIQILGAVMMIHILSELVERVEELSRSFDEMHQDFATHEHEGDGSIVMNTEPVDHDAASRPFATLRKSDGSRWDGSQWLTPEEWYEHRPKPASDHSL